MIKSERAFFYFPDYGFIENKAVNRNNARYRKGELLVAYLKKYQNEKKVKKKQ